MNVTVIPKSRFGLVKLGILTSFFGGSFQLSLANDQTFLDSISANPTSLFPLTNTDGESSGVTNLLFESLLDRHWDTYQWIPSLAKEWKVSPDGKEFTFKLDSNAKFWDGSKVTADDVKFSYDVIFMDGVESASLKPYYDQIEKVEVISPEEIKFRVKEVYYKNFDVVASLTIFKKSHYMDLYQKDKTLAKAESTKTPMGTGQWKIEKWDESQQITMRRDDKYWNKKWEEKEGRWNYDRLIFKIIPEPSLELEHLKKGNLTYMGLNPKQWASQTDGAEFKTKIKKVQTVMKTAVGYNFVGWNLKHPILSNKDVRWALAHLVNLPLWTKNFDYNLTEPTVGPMSVKSEQHDPSVTSPKFDLKEARKRLKAAGWVKPDKDGILIKDGKRFEITIIYPTQSKETVEPKLTQYKNECAKVGIQINLKAVEWTSFTKLLDDRNFDAVTLGWSRAIDPDVKQIWHSASIADKGSNFVNYANPEVDKLIDEHRKTMDAKQRTDLARKIQKMIVEDQPYAFLSERKFTLYAHQSTVKKERDSFPYSIGTSFWKLQAP
jgi:peptide/nickel transport system substrate-binding protein/microcin C transport system substrate-binding protein